MDGFDEDQIWEQIQLENKPTSRRLKKKTKLVRKVGKSNTLVILKEEVDADRGKRKRKVSTPTMLPTLPSQTTTVTSMNDHVSSDSDDEQPSIDTNKHVERKVLRRRSELDDGFFSMEAMEAFQLQEEAALRGDAMGVEEDQSWKDALYGGGADNESGRTDGVNDTTGADFRYADFFKPPEEYAEEGQAVESAENQTNVSSSSEEEEDASSSSDEEDGGDDILYVPSKQYDGSRRGYVFKSDALGVGYYLDVPDLARRLQREKTRNEKKISSSEKTDTTTKPTELSAFAKRQLAMKRKIEELENEAVEKRSWELNGEANRKKRPENSLLEVVLDFDRADKMTPEITVASTETLEDRIKQRILDEAWDDVVRKAPPAETSKRGDDLEDVSQEKNRQGLGELYEHEYMKQQFGAGSDEKERKKREETAESMFRELCGRLDALSNFHFTPLPTTLDLEVKPVKAAAVSMEEVLPMAVSEANVQAPEDVHALSGKRKALEGESERSSEKRQALRRSKKAARRKRLRQKKAEELAVARARPGLGNPYAQKRMLASMRSSKQLVDGKQDRNQGKLTKSTQFFKDLQRTVKEDARAIAASANEEGAGGGRKGKKKSASAKFKL